MHSADTMIQILTLMLCLVSATGTSWLTQLFGGSQRPTTNQTQHHAQSDARHLKCQMLSLCSLGQVKPFLGDIYDGERCLSCLSNVSVRLFISIQQSCSVAFIGIIACSCEYHIMSATNGARTRSRLQSSPSCGPQ